MTDKTSGNLQQRLALYSLAAGAVGLGGHAQAAPVAFDPPGGLPLVVEGDNASAFLDLDNDNVDDAEIYGAGYLQTSTGDAEFYAASPYGTDFYLVDIPSGTAIDANLAVNPGGQFQTGFLELFDPDTTELGITPGESAILAFRLDIQGQFHYGCLNLFNEPLEPTGYRLTVASAFYESEPGVAISACPVIPEIFDDGFEAPVVQITR